MKKRVTAGLLLGGMVMAAPQLALAGNNYTPACTKISNIANVNYQVGGVAQTPVLSNNGVANAFYVGVKVDVLVQRNDNTPVTVYPGSNNAALSFKVTNNGNATQKYALTTTAENGVSNPFALPAVNDNFDPTLVSTNGTAGATSVIASLAPDASQDVTVLVNVPLVPPRANKDLAVYALTAQSQWITNSASITLKNSTTSGSVIGGICAAPGPDAATIDVVAADAAGTNDGPNDGAHSARDAYLVSAANLNITKSSAVYWDPVNGTTSPKAIPGAVVTYTVTISNAAGVADATNVTMVDDLGNEIQTLGHLTFGNGMTGAPNSSFNDGTSVCTGVAGQGIVVGGLCKTNLYSSNDDSASWNDGNDPNGGANKLVVTGLNVAAGSSTTIKYQTTIK